MTIALSYAKHSPERERPHILRETKPDEIVRAEKLPGVLPEMVELIRTHAKRFIRSQRRRKTRV